MDLFPSLQQRYTKDVYGAREAQRLAEFIAWGPVVFQASRLMVKFGILDLLRDSSDGLTEAEIVSATGLSEYTVKCLLEASLCIGTVIVDPSTDKFCISNVGWFLLTDPAAKVNMDFNHDVNYKGFFHLEEAFKEGRPAGLKELGDWPTIYEGLSTLPEEARKSWFAFDHFYSDNSFETARNIIFKRPVKTLLDVGGNTGRFAAWCVLKDPEVEVTILDLPQQIGMMKEATAALPGADRIHGQGINMLDREAAFPSEPRFDAIWMSQFLDCFSPEEIVSILSRAAAIMDGESRLYIMETLWNRQKYEPAAFCVAMTSLYFTAMANGNSKMYYSGDMEGFIEKAGLKVEEIVDGIGQGHSILICRKR